MKIITETFFRKLQAIGRNFAVIFDLSLSVELIAFGHANVFFQQSFISNDCVVVPALP